MRKTKTCPKCQCTKLLHVAAVVDRDEGVHQATLAARHEGYSFMGNEKIRPVGKLEAVTCSACGFTEHYVTDPEELKPDGKTITWLT